MAITQATSLADFSTGIGTAGAVLQVDNADGKVGIGTTDPQGTLQVGIAITMDGTAGVITASSYSGSGSNLSFTGADISAATASFTGNVSVGGTLTYEDVTNIDAVGVITARTGVKVTAGGVDVTAGGLNVTAGGLNVTAGVSTFSGAVSVGDTISLGDHDRLRFGAGNDLQIYHDESNSRIVDSGTGQLILQTSAFRLLNAAGSENMIDGDENGDVKLYHNGSEKLGTKSDGVNITGELECDSLDVDGGVDITGTVNFHNNVSLQDSDILNFGGGNDLQIYHDGSHSYLLEGGTGALKLKGDDIRVENAAGRNILKGTSTATELYFDNGSSSSKKLETTSSGITVTGTLNATTDVTIDGKSAATTGKAVAMAMVFG